MVGIKWRKKDELKLSRYIRKFNASLTRIEKMNPELADSGVLPKRMSVEVVRNRIYTRRDFNRELADIDRWFRKKTQSNRNQSPRDIIDTPSGIRMTRWEYDVAKRRADITFKRRKRVREAFNISKADAERLDLGDISVESKMREIKGRLEDKSKNNFTDIMNERVSWDNFVASVLYQSSDSYYSNKNAIFYNNYHTALYENFEDWQAKDISYLISDLGLDGHQLFVLSNKDDRLEIGYMYSPEETHKKYMLIMSLLPKLAEEVFGIRWEENIMRNLGI